MHIYDQTSQGIWDKVEDLIAFQSFGGGVVIDDDVFCVTVDSEDVVGVFRRDGGKQWVQIESIVIDDFRLANVVLHVIPLFCKVGTIFCTALFCTSTNMIKTSTKLFLCKIY